MSGKEDFPGRINDHSINPPTDPDLKISFIRFFGIQSAAELSAICITVSSCELTAHNFATPKTAFRCTHGQFEVSVKGIRLLFYQIVPTEYLHRDYACQASDAKHVSHAHNKLRAFSSCIGCHNIDNGHIASSAKYQIALLSLYGDFPCTMPTPVSSPDVNVYLSFFVL